MRIAFVTEDYSKSFGSLYPNGCAYYRCLLPRNAAGPDSTVGPPVWSQQHGFGVNNGDGTATFGWDVVLLKNLFQRWLPHQIQQAQKLGQKVIIDVDDLYDDLHDANAAKALLDPDSNRVRNTDHYRAAIEVADMVTVSTPYLRDHYTGVARDVRMIRNGINPHQFSPVKHGTKRRPVIGWAGGMGWRSNDIEELRPWLNDFLVEHDLLFHHAGHDPSAPSFADVAGVDPDRMILSPMVAITDYAASLTFDIGVIPLANIPFNWSKSVIKGLEYAASNIPFVASYSPEYALLQEQGVGRVVASPAMWTTELADLLDIKTRKKEAERQRRLVLAEHTILQRAPEWVQVFMDTYGDGPGCRVPTVRLEYRAI